MNELITSTEDVINQIDLLRKKYMNEYNAKKFAINNYRAYKMVAKE